MAIFNLRSQDQLSQQKLQIDLLILLMLVYVSSKIVYVFKELVYVSSQIVLSYLFVGLANFLLFGMSGIYG